MTMDNPVCYWVADEAVATMEVSTGMVTRGRSRYCLVDYCPG